MAQSLFLFIVCMLRKTDVDELLSSNLLKGERTDEEFNLNAKSTNDKLKSVEQPG